MCVVVGSELVQSLWKALWRAHNTKGVLLSGVANSPTGRKPRMPKDASTTTYIALLLTND